MCNICQHLMRPAATLIGICRYASDRSIWVKKQQFVFFFGYWQRIFIQASWIINTYSYASIWRFCYHNWCRHSEKSTGDIKFSCCSLNNSFSTISNFGNATGRFGRNTGVAFGVKFILIEMFWHVYHWIVLWNLMNRFTCYVACWHWITCNCVELCVP